MNNNKNIILWGAITFAGVVAGYILYKDTYFSLAFGVTVVIFACQIYFSFQDIKDDNSHRESLIMNLGIFGTFMGIVIGLAEFNAADLDNSIYALLSGMKTAFLTSAIGLAYNCILIFKNMGEAKEENTFNSFEDLQERYMNDAMKFFAKQNELISTLVGEGDNTILAQLQGLRGELSNAKDEILTMGFDDVKDSIETAKDEILNTGFDGVKDSINTAKTDSVQELQALKKSFDDFAEESAKNNTKAVTEALERAMKDFNQNLTEQFGENFKQLNASVDKLLDWQNNYKEHIETTTTHLNEVLGRFDSAQDSLEIVSENAESLLNAGNKIKEEHGEILDQLATLSTFKKDIEELPTSLRLVVDDFGRLPDDIKELSVNTFNNLEVIFDGTEDALKQHHGKLVETGETSIKQIEKAFIEGANSVEQVSNQLKGNFSDAVNDNINQTINFVKNVETELHGQVSTIVGGFGDKLTTITNELYTLVKPLSGNNNNNNNNRHNNNNNRR